MSRFDKTGKFLYYSRHEARIIKKITKLVVYLLYILVTYEIFSSIVICILNDAI